MPSAGIYIHIPFCKVKCNYCDFYSITEREYQREIFTKMLCREIELYIKENQFEFIIDTIFLVEELLLYLKIDKWTPYSIV